MSTATTGAAVTARTPAAVSAAASTSSTDGRQGSSTRSATLAATCAALSLPARGGVSMIARYIVISKAGQYTALYTLPICAVYSCYD